MLRYWLSARSTRGRAPVEWLFIPIAWNPLRLQILSKHEQDASKVLNPTQLKVLRAPSKAVLPAHMSVRDAMLAIAKLGGHVKRNGDPGWITLGAAMSACSPSNRAGNLPDPETLVGDTINPET